MTVLVGRVGFTLQAPWLKGRSFDLIDYNDNVLQEGLIKTEALVIPADLPVYLVEVTAAED